MSGAAVDLSRLTDEQRGVVECWGRGMAIMAGAGCGKTTTLVNKCLALLARKSDARFAAVSFTERSAGDLRAKLAKRIGGEGDPLARHWVMTIHGLCGSIIREFPREAGYDGEESMLSEPEAQVFWEQAIEGLWLDEIPEEIRILVDTLLSRESRENLGTLVRRVRAVRSFGALESLAASKDPSSRALEIVARFVMERYERLKRRQGALDFDDLESGADRALEDPKVRRYYQGRFDLVLVDEFQDTNPVQARILWRLIRPDASNLCVVGDPKQSIYRFRDADVSVFEEFCSRLPERRSLTWNFRSRPGIIEYTNEVCAPAFSVTQMLYEALVPKREAHPEQESVIRLEESGPEALAAWLRAEVDRGVPLHEFALLLRKIRGNEKWLRALTAAGIPIAIGSGGLFWEDPRVREMVALLKWWDNPAHLMSAAVFLRAPWVGVEDATLDQWIGSAQGLSAFSGEREARLAQSFFSSEHPMALALAPLRKRLVRPAEVLAAVLLHEGIEQELGAPFLGLWHRVEELSSRGMDFHSVVTELVRSVEESRRERDVPPPRNLGQLRVLTLHGSKGLEFPHVILVDFGNRVKSADAPLLYWDRERGAFLAGRDVDLERQHKKDPVEKEWKSIEDAKNLAESMRLFYVALTRAQERLVLVCPPLPPPKETKTPKKEEAPEAVYQRDHWRGWIDRARQGVAQSVKPQVLSSAVNLTEGSSDSPRRLLRAGVTRWRRPRHSVTEWNLLSRCPRAYEWTYVRPVVVELGASSEESIKEMQVERETGELSQRELGTEVHRCLEEGDWDGLKALELKAGKRRLSAEPLISWAESSSLMQGASSGHEDLKVWSELAFEFRVDGETIVGAMDRVVRLREGDRWKYVLVDFKVTGAPKSEASLLERYGAQMRLYGCALESLMSDAEQGEIEAWLVNISPQGVSEIRVPIPASAEQEVKRLAQLASEIVNGTEGMPCPGDVCAYCPFQPRCPEGVSR